MAYSRRSMGRRRAAGPSWRRGRRRSRIPARRMARRALPYSNKRVFTSSVNQDVGTLNYRRKPLNKALWKKRLWNASNASVKYRSNNSFLFTLASATAQQLVEVHALLALNDSSTPNRFWETAGGLLDTSGASVTTDFGNGDIFIRGGTYTITFTNTTGVVFNINIWDARSKENGSLITTPFSASRGWDPSLQDVALVGDQDITRFYNFWNQRSVLLNPDESVQFTRKIMPCKIQESNWINFRMRDLWLMSIGNLTTAAAANVSVTTAFNLSFTADRIT